MYSSSGAVFLTLHKYHTLTYSCDNSPQLSDDENKALYGKCFNTHGHNYVGMLPMNKFFSVGQCS